MIALHGLIDDRFYARDQIFVRALVAKEGVRERFLPLVIHQNIEADFGEQPVLFRAGIENVLPVLILRAGSVLVSVQWKGEKRNALNKFQ